MIIRQVFGDSSKYANDLTDIRFHVFAYSSSTPESDHVMAWDSGKSNILSLFKTMLEELQISTPHERSHDLPTSHDVRDTQAELSNRMFIVHGHEKEMKEAVARTLSKLGLDPIILHERPNQGRTIIEKFTDYSDVSSAVVLLSPDDLAYPKNRFPKDAKLRPRQNVVFELGFFIGKLGRERVFVLHREDQNFEMPSDYSGVLYIPYNESTSWQTALVTELKACGYQVDANKLV